jgi:hypothetical protein
LIYELQLRHPAIAIAGFRKWKSPTKDGINASDIRLSSFMQIVRDSLGRHLRLSISYGKHRRKPSVVENNGSCADTIETTGAKRDKPD